MSAKKGFSKKELADQSTKVADLAKEESKLQAAIERGEKTLAENREKLKETQRTRANENAVLEQMIQKGIKAAARGDSEQRAALIAALLMGSDGDASDPEPEGDRKSASARTPAPEPSPTPTPSPASDGMSASTETPASTTTTEGDDAQNEAA